MQVDDLICEVELVLETTSADTADKEITKEPAPAVDDMDEEKEDFYGFSLSTQLPRVSVGKINDTRTSIRCDYLAHSAEGQLHIARRKRGPSRTMISHRFIKPKTICQQLPVSQTVDHATAAINLSAAAAASTPTTTTAPSSKVMRPASRASGRKRNATNRLADEMLTAFKAKITKPNSGNLTEAAAGASDNPTAIVAAATFCPPPSTPHRRMRKREQAGVDLQPPITVRCDTIAIVKTTTTRSGRRSVMPKPFLQERFRIKVEPTY